MDVGSTPLWKTDSPSSKRHHLPLAPSLGVGAHEPHLCTMQECRQDLSCADHMQAATAAMCS